MRSLNFIWVIDLGPLPVRFSDFLIGGVRRYVKQRIQFSIGRSVLLFLHASTNLLSSLLRCVVVGGSYCFDMAVGFRGLGVFAKAGGCVTN